MKHTNSSQIRDILRFAAPLGASLLMAGYAAAQSYTVVDLSPAAGNATATGVSGNIAAGYSAPGINGTAARATVWDSQGAVDMHPAFLDNTVTGNIGRSYIHDISGALQVGAGIGTTTGSVQVPIAWTGSAESAVVLPIPFISYGGIAYATDGVQIVGTATGQNTEATGPGTTHAMLWNAATGAATDLGDGGKGAMAYGVGGGQQVGIVNKGNAAAALWRSTPQSLVSLAPKGAVISVANSTDGVRQAGYAGYDVRVRNEAPKGNKEQRFTYAMVWTGTAASARNIHPYPANIAPGVALNNSYALAMNSQWIVGYAGDQNKFGTPAYNHAIVWDSAYESTDLNAFLPAGFVGAQATGVDAAGNVSGFMARADGTRHAAVWLLNAPAQ